MIYKDGTITLVSGSAIAKGTGTKFKANINGVSPGATIQFQVGATVYNNSVLSVNSDTEIVLAFPAPVAGNNVNYAILTTMTESYGDGVRKMMADVTYITYFLRNMDAWMTDNGIVEIELPNGQKVTLDSVKAMNEAIAKKADSSKLGTAAWKNVGTADGNVMEVGAFGLGGEAFASDGDMQDTTRPTNFFSQSGGVGQNYFGAYGSGVNFKYDDQIAMRLFVFGGTGHVSVVVRDSGAGRTLWVDLLDSTNTLTDSNGYIKKSSPIIQIHPDGNYETNDESEGAEVRRTGTGQYHITGILGYNSDGAWGVNGGISVPKDNNGLELVYVDDRVQEDGSLIIETCHRQHVHLPERFQNWRLKEITAAGDRVFYQDGEPCDLPESTRLDVRVEMPQGSVWNVKQRELAEQMEREQAEREAQENN